MSMGLEVLEVVSSAGALLAVAALHPTGATVARARNG